ncbi:MAG: TetR family transcriptional regulator [Actinomycetota bacterium]
MTLKGPRSAEAFAPNLRERKKTATRRALREASLRLFRDKGFGATSVDEIAAAADVSRSTFFRYFGSKEAVLFADANEAGEVFIRLLAGRPDHENSLTAFEESLVQLNMTSDASSQRGISRLLEQLMRDDPVLRVRRIVEIERWTDAVAAGFAQRNGNGEPGTEDKLAAAICMATVEQIGREWRELDDGPSPEDAIRKGFAATRALIGTAGAL